MFDSGPASDDNHTKASAEKPLVGAFTAPPGAVDTPVTLVAGRVGDDAYADGTAVDPAETIPSGFQFGDYSFEIGVADENGSRVDGFVFAKPAIISVAYEPETLLDNTGQDHPDARCLPELLLYDTYSQSWIEAKDTCPPPGRDEPAPWQNLDPVTLILDVQICHLTQFAVAINFDDCVDNHCVRGTCMDGRDAYTCSCPSGWEGRYCQLSVDECLGPHEMYPPAGNCTNGAGCIDRHLNYTCVCAGGFMGRFCELIDPSYVAPAPPPTPPSPVLALIISFVVLIAAMAASWYIKASILAMPFPAKKLIIVDQSQELLGLTASRDLQDSLLQMIATNTTIHVVRFSNGALEASPMEQSQLTQPLGPTILISDLMRDALSETLSDLKPPGWWAISWATPQAAIKAARQEAVKASRAWRNSNSQRMFDAAAAVVMAGDVADLGGQLRLPLPPPQTVELVDQINSDSEDEAQISRAVERNRGRERVQLAHKIAVHRASRSEQQEDWDKAAVSAAKMNVAQEATEDLFDEFGPVQRLGKDKAMRMVASTTAEATDDEEMHEIAIDRHAVGTAQPAAVLSQHATEFQEFVQRMNTSGLQCLKQGQREEALRFLTMAKEAVLDAQKTAAVDSYTRSRLKAVTLSNLGCFCNEVGQLHLSLEYCRTALEIERWLPDVQSDVHCNAYTHLILCSILSKLNTQTAEYADEDALKTNTASARGRNRQTELAVRHAKTALELVDTQPDAFGNASVSVRSAAYYTMAVQLEVTCLVSMQSRSLSRCSQHAGSLDRFLLWRFLLHLPIAPAEEESA